MCTSGVANAPNPHPPQVPVPMLSTNGTNRIYTGRYEFEFAENEVWIRDIESGTETRFWGDPHLWTGDGDKIDFHENLTIDLPDGTKVTFQTTPQDENGIAYIDSVAVMNGTEAVVVNGIHDGQSGVQMGNVLNNADSVDDQYEDGTVLRAGAEVDDFTYAANGEEIRGEYRDEDGSWARVDGMAGQSANQFGTLGAENNTPGTNGQSGAQDPAAGGTGDPMFDGTIFEPLFDNLDGLFDQLTTKLGKLGEIDSADPANESAMAQLQLELQMIQELITQTISVITNVMKSIHDGRMAVAGNLRA